MIRFSPVLSIEAAFVRKELRQPRNCAASFGRVGTVTDWRSFVLYIVDSSLILAEPAPTDLKSCWLRAMGLPPFPLPSPGSPGHDGSWVLGGETPPFPLPPSPPLDDDDDDGVSGGSGGRGLFGGTFIKLTGTYPAQADWFGETNGDATWTEAWGETNGDPGGNWLGSTGLTGVAMLNWLGMACCCELCDKDLLRLSSFICLTSFLNAEMHSIKSSCSAPFWEATGVAWWRRTVTWFCNDRTIACISWARSLCSVSSDFWDSKRSCKFWFCCSDCCNCKLNSPCAKLAECWSLESSSRCWAFNWATWALASEWIWETRCSAPITLTSATLWASWDCWWNCATAFNASARTWDSRACATAGSTPTLNTFNCCCVRWSW